jgi:transposase-like protein
MPRDPYSSQWAAIESIAGKIGCTAETLRAKWVRQGERDSGVRPGPTTTEQQRVKELECQVRELRKINEILKFTRPSRQASRRCASEMSRAEVAHVQSAGSPRWQ